MCVCVCLCFKMNIKLSIFLLVSVLHNAAVILMIALDKGVCQVKYSKVKIVPHYFV